MQSLATVDCTLLCAYKAMNPPFREYVLVKLDFVFLKYPQEILRFSLAAGHLSVQILYSVYLVVLVQPLGGRLMFNVRHL